VRSNGREALAALTETRFDLVLMDVQMPELDGRSAAREWRAIEATLGRSPVPIVAMTADAEAETGAACRAAGMDGFLAKPFGIAALRHCLQQHLRAPPAQDSTRVRASGGFFAK
jgi:CheY-like chemotaxis protein